MLDILKKLVAVDSTEAEPQENAPFGVRVREALDVFLAQAKALGLKTHDGDGYYGWAELGEGEQMLAVACHIDIVPATGVWSHPPFEMIEKDGRVYGRGVADDKGPLAACLKLMGDWKKQGKSLSGRRLRLIVGCNEESGSLCMKKYNEVDEAPLFTLIPDADFPIVNSEKGIYRVTVKVNSGELTQNATVTSGERPNIVPDLAVAQVKAGSKLAATLSSVSDPDVTADGLTLTATGIAAHAMCPTHGDNAAFKLLRFLSSALDCGDLGEAVNKVCVSPIPASLGIACEDKASGELTINLGMVRTEKDGLLLTFDCRLPVCADYNAVREAIERATNGVTVSEDYTPNLYIPEDSAIVKALVGAYCEVTGDVPHCTQTGGGTYARSLPAAIAYGPTFEGEETNIHNADESIPVEHLRKLYEIYDVALVRLNEVL